MTKDVDCFKEKLETFDICIDDAKHKVFTDNLRVKVLIKTIFKNWQVIWRTYIR